MRARATENEEEVFAGNPLVLRLSSLCASCIPPHSRRTARRCNVHFYGRSQSGRHAGYALSAYRVAFYAILSRLFRLLFFSNSTFFLSRSLPPPSPSLCSSRITFLCTNRHSDTPGPDVKIFTGDASRARLFPVSLFNFEWTLMVKHSATLGRAPVNFIIATLGPTASEEDPHRAAGSHDATASRLSRSFPFPDGGQTWHVRNEPARNA